MDNLLANQHLGDIWTSISERIEKAVPAETFGRWFKGISLVGVNEEQLELQVPNSIFQLWIESNYMGVVQDAIVRVLHSPKKLVFRFAEAPAGELAAPPEPASTDLAADLEKEKAPPARLTEPMDDRRAPPPSSPVGLNSRYTFDTFVVGANNQFAHAASLAVAQAPAKVYNPFFIYGGVGLGKTHLMQAIGQYLSSRKKGAKVLYISSERFTNEFIDAIQNQKLVAFRKRYRQADILLIDDIQFLAGKERSQEEFFHTFNTLSDGQKQIVLSSDRPPSEIANLEARLVSRFEWGLTAEMQPPDIETRLAILRKKAQTLQVDLPPNILEYLAERIRTNVRRMEGALMRVATFASLSGGELNQTTIEHLLKDILQEEARKVVSIELIQKKVAEHFDIRLADMTSKRRPQNIALPRQVAMYLARELTKQSLMEIGEAFGGRDHGTVLHACRTIKARMHAEDSFRHTVSFLESQVQR